MKRIFETYADIETALALEPAEAGAFRFFPEQTANAAFRCSVCKQAVPFKVDGCSPGYAIQRDTNAMLCYACADAAQRDELKIQQGPFYCYVSGDKKTVMTWTGGALGNVHSYGESSAGWNAGTIARFHVRDIHGQWWAGRGAGAGMRCTLRRMKHVPTYARHWGYK